MWAVCVYVYFGRGFRGGNPHLKSLSTLPRPSAILPFWANVGSEPINARPCPCSPRNIRVLNFQLRVVRPVLCIVPSTGPEALAVYCFPLILPVSCLPSLQFTLFLDASWHPLRFCTDPYWSPLILCLARVYSCICMYKTISTLYNYKLPVMRIPTRSK